MHLTYGDDFAKVFKDYVQLLKEEKDNSYSTTNPDFRDFADLVKAGKANWLHDLSDAPSVSGVGVHVKESGHESSEPIIDEIRV